MIGMDGSDRSGRRMMEERNSLTYSPFCFFLFLPFFFSFLYPFPLFLSLSSEKFFFLDSYSLREFTSNEDIKESFVFEESMKDVKQNVKGYVLVREM